MSWICGTISVVYGFAFIYYGFLMNLWASTGAISYFLFENVENPSLLDHHYSRNINIFCNIDQNS